jgi:hypothetical protein
MSRIIIPNHLREDFGEALEGKRGIGSGPLIPHDPDSYPQRRGFPYGRLGLKFGSDLMATIELSVSGLPAGQSVQIFREIVPGVAQTLLDGKLQGASGAQALLDEKWQGEFQVLEGDNRRGFRLFLDRLTGGPTTTFTSGELVPLEDVWTFLRSMTPELQGLADRALGGVAEWTVEGGLSEESIQAFIAFHKDSL